MKSTHIARIIFCSSLLFAGGAQALAQVALSDAAAVAATVESFHAALSSGNTEAATKLLAPDAVVLESGDKETRKQYVGHHLLEDIKFAKAVPSTRGQPEVMISGDVAWTSSTSVTQGTYQSKALHLVGAELMVLTRTPSGWQIRAIHWSSRKGK
jgi:ketosteroid isomerase-like protein